MKMKQIALRIRLWWTGYADVDSTLHDPDAKDAHFLITMHPPSRIKVAVESLAAFWMRNWQFVIATLLTLIGLILAAMAL